MIKQFPFALSASALMALAAAGCASVSPPEESATKPVKRTGATVYRSGDIMNARAGALDDLLGPAALTRREGEGEYRRYALSQCALIIILYPDEKGVSRVKYVDAAALKTDEETPDLADCLAAG